MMISFILLLMFLVFIPVVTIFLLFWYASNFKDNEKYSLKKHEKYSLMQIYNSTTKVNYYRYGITRKRN